MMTIETMHPLKATATDPGCAGWLEELDFNDPFTATREELDQLIQSAPSQRLADWARGIFDFREMLAIVTGRPF